MKIVSVLSSRVSLNIVLIEKERRTLHLPNLSGVAPPSDMGFYSIRNSVGGSVHRPRHSASCGNAARVATETMNGGSAMEAQGDVVFGLTDASNSRASPFREL